MTEGAMDLGQETIQRGTSCNGKSFLVFPFLVGFVFAIFVSPAIFTGSEVTEPSIKMLSAPSCGLRPVSVPKIQAKLKNMGIPSSPMEKFALTSFAATRDPSMKAQVREEFLKLDPTTQAKVKKLSKQLVVRAAAFDPEDLPGITEPLGFWDPAGFAKDERVLAYRRAELKHGRVCMLSGLGIIVAEKYHPIFDDWNDGPFVSAMASHFSETATKNFWPAFWIMAAGHELATSFVEYEGKDVGDYGFDPLNIKPKDPEELLALQNKELNNGRLAMVSVAGIIAQELVTGTAIF